ncbi:MAG: carbonic anhydrase/acetyltransferase-like protein (isoleucine patch superfamily) [bacterium]|jgi:carbonic anhydrase/acetyltransferase-like protein (isoleucine patch superfamily)
MLYALNDKRPTISGRYFVAPSASVIGDVVINEGVTIWFNAVLRGDNETITIGTGSNIQDGSVLHVDEGVPLTIGNRVTIGHKVMLHGCEIGDGSLIGMNAVVLNNAVIGKNCLIGANALVTEGMQIPDGSLVLGSPAKVIKPVTEVAMEMMRSGVQHYIDKIDVYNDGLVALGPD